MIASEATYSLTEIDCLFFTSYLRKQMATWPKLSFGINDRKRNLLFLELPNDYVWNEIMK